MTRASGKPYDQYVAANILQPLGMTSTTLHPSRVPANRRAVGYRWEDERWKEEPALPHGSFGSMGGMLTSVRGWSGGRANQPGVTSRDATAMASIGDARAARPCVRHSATD